MAATKYTYSISVDFPNSAVAPSKFKQEYEASPIVTAFDYIETSGDICDIWTKDVLSPGDETTLNGLVAAHDGVPDPADAVNEFGIPCVAVTAGNPDRELIMVGRKFTVPAGSITDHDTPFPEIRGVQGAMLVVSDNQPGDFVDIQIVDPPSTVLNLYSETLYVPPDGQVPPVVSEGVIEVPPGIVVRIKYTTDGGGIDREVYATYRTRK